MAVKAQATCTISNIKDVVDNASTAQSTASKAQETADTAKANAAAAQIAAEAAQSTADTAKSDAASAQSTAEAEVTNRTTLIREYNDGVLVCKTGNNIGALVNADGSFDVVSVTWSDGTPTVGDTLSTFGADSLRIGQSGSANIVLSSSAFEMYATNGGRIISIDPTGGSGNMAFRDSIGGNETKALSTTPVSGSTITVRLSRRLKAGKSFVSLFGSATFTYGTAATKTITDSDTASDTGTTYTMNVTVTYDGSTTITTTTNSGVTPSGYITYTALGQVTGMTVSGSIDAANINGYDITAEDKVSAPAVQATQVLYGEAGSITTDLDVGGDITAGGSISMDGTNISSIFSGAISIGYKDKSLSIAAGGKTGEETINLAKSGYSARCICGWNLSDTGSSYCVVTKLFINEMDQQLHFYVRNNGSSKATPTLRTYILYTKNN